MAKTKNFNDKLKEAIITKDKLLIGKLIWLYYDSDGQIAELDSLENINWIENGAKQHSHI
jgi:hypothetical protein